MPIRPIGLAEATPEQRRAYVRNFLNLDVSDSDSDDAVATKITQAQPGVQQIFVNEPDSPEEVAAQETETVTLKPEEGQGRQSGTLGGGDPRAIIMIPIVETEDGSGARDVLVGVNGRGWQLKRGVDLNVPWRVVEALKSAQADIVRHRNDEGHEGEVVVHKALRYNFNMVQAPSKAEIDAWLERTGAEFCA